jgi:plasmid stabilization system protein ParE
VTYEVYVTDKAKRQLEDAARWWGENRSAEQAERWYGGFVTEIQSLEKNPGRFPLARENDVFPVALHELHYGLGRKKTHRAIFAIRPERVIVYSVRHVAQRDLTGDDI